MKYLVLSFEDNTDHDIKVIEILNKYRLKGTFFVNSGSFDKDGFIGGRRLNKVYEGHEVASHSLNHLHLKNLSKDEIRYQIKEDIANIKQFTKEEIYGFAYPFGEYSKKIQDVLVECGIKYARTEVTTMDFNEPPDFLQWHPTMHLSGTDWDSGDKERVMKGIRFMFDKLEEFLEDYDAPLLHLWMHSWEFNGDKDLWDQFDRLCRMISMEDEVEVVTAYEYYRITKGI